MSACTVLLPRRSEAQIDHVLDGAAHALWPTLAPLIHDMLARKPRKPVKTPRS